MPLFDSRENVFIDEWARTSPATTLTQGRTSMRRVGDFIVAFPDSPSRGAGRNGTTWEVLLSDRAWSACSQEPSETWSGYPFHSVQQGGWRVWLLGEMFGSTGDLDQELSDFVTRRGAPREANGHFLVFGHESKTKTWHVWTNRFGTLHAYHGWDGTRGAIGTFSRSVAALASRKQLDWRGWTGFFALGFFPGDRTQFEDVKILRPASHYVFDYDGRLIGRDRYWQWWHEPRRDRSFAETLEEFRLTLDTVLDDLTSRGTIAVPISGGLDSRTTVATLTRRGGNAGASGEASRFRAYSYGYSPDSEETEIARQVALARGLAFRSYVIEPYLFEKLPLVLNAVEGFQDLTQSRQASVVEELSSDADSVIAAHWGDVWLDDMGWSEEGREQDLLTHALGKVTKEGRGWLLEQVCGERASEPPDAVLRDEVRSELEGLAHLADQDFRVKAFKTEQWSFRWTSASLRAFQIGLVPRLPFYDIRMSDFLCTVPTEFVRGRRLQIDYLKRHAPDLAGITWQAYGTNLVNYRYFNTLLLPKRAVAKLFRIAARRRVTERNWEVQFLCEEGRRELERRLIRPGLGLHEFVSPAATRALLEEFFREPFAAKRGYSISMLLTFSSWLEQSLG